MEPLPRVLGERSRLGIAINLDGLLRSIDDEPAILALSQVLLNGCFQRRVELAIEVIRQLNNDSLAVQLRSAFRKKRSSLPRSFSRALSKRDFTAGTDRPKASAVSSVDNSSMSRS